jgi:hypothetical protein
MAAKLSFEGFVHVVYVFNSTKWKHAYLLLPLKTQAVFAHAQTISPPVAGI